MSDATVLLSFWTAKFLCHIVFELGGGQRVAYGPRGSGSAGPFSPQLDRQQIFRTRLVGKYFGRKFEVMCLLWELLHGAWLHQNMVYVAILIFSEWVSLNCNVYSMEAS